MGIDLATWRARIGLNYYHMCRPLQTRWRSSGDQLYQSGVASWGVGEVMNDMPLVLKGCMTVVALSLILQYVVHSWPRLKGRGGSGKVRCHWRGSTSQVKVMVDGGGTLLLRAIVVVIPLLLVIAGDVETNPGPEGVALTLKATIKVLHSVCPKWYNIGVQLEVPTFQLEIIEKKSSDLMDQLRDTLDYWMSNNPSASWRHLVDALKAPSIGEKRLAEEIEEEYCDVEEESSCNESRASIQTKHHQEVPNQGNNKTSEETSFAAALGTMLTAESSTMPGQHTKEEPNCLTKVEESEAIHSGNTSLPPSEGSQRPPFGCGCGKCTFFSFIEKGCPTPIPSASSFPYLNLSGLTHEQHQDLRGRLRSESQEIRIRFQKLVSATIKSFKRRCVPLDELVSHVMTLGTFDPVFKESQVPVFHFCFKELKAADTILKAFMILNDYFSFFNYHILEHIIKKLGTEEDKAELQRYKEDFNQYAKRRIFECLPEFGPVSDADHGDIFVKLDSQYDNYTVAQIEGFRHKLSDILRVSSHGILRLCRVDKGCFQLMFQVPLFLQQKIFPLSRKQEKALAAIGVIRLTCGEYQFLKDEPQTRNEDKHQHDADDDSGMGPISLAFSEDHLDKELKELDYEIKVQGLVEIASAQKSGSHLELSFAVAVGQLEYVKFLVEEKHCNPMQKDQDGIAPFHMAAIVGNVQALKYFITECNCNPACLGPLGLTPLHLASEQGHLDIVKYLVIEQQMDPLCEDEYGNTALHRASAGGFQAVVEFLTSEFEKYTPIVQLMSAHKNKWNSTPLHSAVVNGHLDILRFFTSDQKCDPNLPGQYSKTPLHYAAEFGHIHIVKYLIDELGCNPFCLNEINHTPLYCAALNGHIDIVKFLIIERYCDPMCGDLNLNTPLHMAAHNGHKDIVKFLILEVHCDPMCGNAGNDTPVHLATVKGHLDIIHFLISDLNCDPNIPGWCGKTPLHYAAQFGHLHIVKYLTDEQGCNPSRFDEDKDTPLHLAAWNGHIDIVKFLTVEKHCDPTCRDSSQNTPLHMAAQNGHVFIVKFLTLEMYCDPTSRNADNDTALHLAIVKGHLDIIHFLISDLNCDPNIPGWCGKTPLHYAAQFGHLHIVKYLTDEQGSNPSCLDEDKDTPLHLAAWNGHIDTVKFLTVEKHCDPMCQDSSQNTPLHMAAQNGHVFIVKFLILEMHCDPTSRNINSATAKQVAAEHGHLELLQFFDQNCDPNITDDHYLSICEQVMREYGKMDQTIMHCIFVGPPGVGKSSLLKRLLRMKVDPVRASTQVVEKSVRVEVIRDVSTAVAQVSGIDWQIIEDPTLQASELIGQLSTKSEMSKLGDQVSKQIESTITQASGHIGPVPTKQTRENLSTVGDSNEQVSEQTVQAPISKVLSISKQITSESAASEPSQLSQFGKTIDFLRHVLKEKGVSGLQQRVNPWTLYLTDSGGQPEFQELLPALVAGPCVFFVVLPLNKELNEKYEVEYMRPNEQKYMQKYLSSLSVQEDLMRSLASIASTKYKDKDGKEVKPRVMLIATFKDQVPLEEDRQRKLKKLEALVKETDAFRQGMIVDASETQMVFSINNVSDEESARDTKEIRDAFQIIADGFHVSMPSPWLFFSILVQHEYAEDSVISRQECFEVAKECGIHNETEFEAALQFLHRQTGVLHYYKEPPELSQIVIKDPQYLFSRVNQLVEKTFTFVKTRCSQCTNDFKKGIFELTDYETLTNKSSQSKLNPSMLLKLLEHVNVVVPLGDGERYFMPCAIAHLEDTGVGHTQSANIPPLLITFKSGYCPKGLFGALVACIANKQVANCTLNLDESKIHRDQICFTMDQHHLLLRVNPTYIYIEVIPYSPDAALSTLCTICNGVCKLILENIKTACKTLHYSNNADCGLSFECPCDQYGQHEKFHPAVLRCDLNNCFWCIQSQKVVYVKKKCYIWFPQPTILQHPVRQSVASETEAVFEVKSTGKSLQFQWQKNCSDLCDGDKYCDTDTDTLRIVEVEKGDKGRYRCLVKNDIGWEFSDEALLTVTDPPKVTQHPKDQSVSIGTDIIFNVGAIGDCLQFQWQKNRTDLCDGERYLDTNTDTLRVIQVKNDDKGHYRCLVKNDVGRKFSEEAFLTIKLPDSTPVLPPGILQQSGQLAYPQYLSSQQLYSEGDLCTFKTFAETSFVVTDSHSHSFEWQRYGLKLHIPEGAVPAQHTECRVVIKACLTGQFIIPDDLQLVSCVYWLSCPQKFLKPVTLEIEHCASFHDSSQFSRLRFIVANSSQEKLPYQFRVLEQGTFVHSYGSIQVSQFSFFGISILKRIWRSWLPTYYSRLHYIQKDVNTWDVDYVVTLHLQAALTAVEDKYSSLGATHGPGFEVQFEGDTIRLEIDENGVCLQNGWEITPLIAPVIEKQQVDGFQSWKEAPYCRLKVTFDKDRKPVELKHKVKLLGVKGPHNFFTITCIAEGERYFMSKCGYKENGKYTMWSQIQVSEFFPHPVPPPSMLQPTSQLAYPRSPSSQQLYNEGDGLILSEQDLHILTEIMRPATPQWRTIGGSLGFLDSDLNIIQHSPLLIPEGTPGYFREMLSQWLKRAPPNHPWPTLKTLAVALQSSGHECLAVSLALSYAQRKADCPKITHQRTAYYNWKTVVKTGGIICVLVLVLLAGLGIGMWYLPVRKNHLEHPHPDEL